MEVKVNELLFPRVETGRTSYLAIGQVSSH
jgi:hypothetical protein